MSRAPLAAAALALLAAAAPARAEERLAGIGSFEFQGAQYLPNIDSEFPQTSPGPWESSFGTSRRWIWKIHGGKALFHGYGTLELGGGIGYFSASGHGRFASDNSVSQEKTGFKMMPMALDLTYRLDQAWERAGIPVVPYVRLALLRDQWWVTGSGGSKSASGATNGWSWGGGLGLVLDFIDTTLSRELDRDSGIKHTMLVFEATRTNVHDFGSSKSWDLSNDGTMLSFGLLFAF
jgi:hypothetical protein